MISDVGIFGLSMYVSVLMLEDNMHLRNALSTAAVPKIEYLKIPIENDQCKFSFQHTVKIVSEYDQEIPQSQTADKPVAS